MGKLNIELCPETGICSIIRNDGKKIDLMPNEVCDVRQASGKLEAIKQTLAEVDGDFAAELGAEELQQVSSTLKSK
jgi:hypothetical protein